MKGPIIAAASESCGYCLSDLPDSVLLRDLAALVLKERTTTAALLAYIAEVDARRLFVAAGHSSMFAYCVAELRLSEDATAKRIQAARAARRCPVLFTALAEGRLHLTAVWLLAPHVTPENVHELIAVATHRRRPEIEELVARRFSLPAPKVRLLTPVAPLRTEHAPGHVNPAALDVFDQRVPTGAPDQGVSTSVAFSPDVSTDSHALGHVEGEVTGPVAAQTQHAPRHVARPAPQERYLLQLMIDRQTRDKLQHVIALLSHAVPDGNPAEVIGRALDALTEKLEKRRLGVEGARASQPGTHARHIPKSVRRAVWKRDGGQCTFVGEGGHRCGSRKRLEFDHVNPVSRGGGSTESNLRLRCRKHNQYEAERIFGARFMDRKRTAES